MLGRPHESWGRGFESHRAHQQNQILSQNFQNVCFPVSVLGSIWEAPQRVERGA